MARNKPRKKTLRSDDGNAFIPESALITGAGDDLAQQLAEDHQPAVTTGEDDAEDERDALQTEEIGGPFIVSGAEEEFGDTMTSEGSGELAESNDTETETNALLEVVGSLAIASAEEAEEERESVESREEQTGETERPDAGAEPPSRVEANLVRWARQKHAPAR